MGLLLAAFDARPEALFGLGRDAAPVKTEILGLGDDDVEGPVQLDEEDLEEQRGKLVARALVAHERSGAVRDEGVLVPQVLGAGWRESRGIEFFRLRVDLGADVGRAMSPEDRPALRHRESLELEGLPCLA